MLTIDWENAKRISNTIITMQLKKFLDNAQDNSGPIGTYILYNLNYYENNNSKYQVRPKGSLHKFFLIPFSNSNKLEVTEKLDIK